MAPPPKITGPVCLNSSLSFSIRVPVGRFADISCNITILLVIYFYMIYRNGNDEKTLVIRNILKPDLSNVNSCFLLSYFVIY